MNILKLIIGKDIVGIIGKYLLPCKILIESNRKLNLFYLKDNIEWIKIYLNDNNKIRIYREYVNGYYWTMR
jgi:hypothetical protein